MKSNELRNYLLPMLMNWQVAVDQAKTQLGMVSEGNGKYGEV